MTGRLKRKGIMLIADGLGDRPVDELNGKTPLEYARTPVLDELCRRVDERDSFDEKAKDYLVPCKYTVESAAAGAAIFYIDEFFNTI